MRCLVVCLVLGAVVADLGFQQWSEQHGKVYNSWSERQYREQVWTKNLNKILAHNIKHVRGEVGYSMAINEFGDLTFEEFRRHKTCFGNVGFNASADALGTPKIHYKGSTFMAPLNYTAPKAVDFRKLGYVTKVKNQEACGSCWAFSTTGSIEGQHFRKTGKLVSLSEQQLVDCSTSFGNDGCDGGLMDWGFTYAMSVKGLETETSYPYTAEDGDCVYDKTKAVVKINGFQDIPAGSEAMLMSAIAANGPISVAIDASQSSFQFYSKGVYDEPDCSSTELDHGVLAVGYGTLGGKDYYIVKNSWGATWGLDGYILMSRNKKNQCGIATSASYPLI